jgi:hypothetical protein
MFLRQIAALRCRSSSFDEEIVVLRRQMLKVSGGARAGAVNHLTSHRSSWRRSLRLLATKITS